jgi:hypothetical protein
MPAATVAAPIEIGSAALQDYTEPTMSRLVALSVYCRAADVFTNLLSEVNEMRCKTTFLLTVVICLAGTRATFGQEATKPVAAAMSHFKALAGEWVGKGTHGDMSHDAKVVYKVTSGGSAVVETIDPGGMHEMITVIHPDGDALLLTHYCMIGNQPQMKAVPKPGDKQVAFEFVRATNMKSDQEMHMRSVTFTFVDPDTLKAEWTNWDGGKEAGKSVFELKRKK